MRARRTGAAALVLGLLLAAGAGGGDPARAAGATVTETGWWSRSPDSATPAGGFQVAKSADGDLSVAALRITVEGTLTKALLVVKEAPGGLLQDRAAIVACPTTSTWTAASPGPFAEAPKPDCSRKVSLARNATASTWAADVLPLLAGSSGTASLMLLPGPSTTPAVPVDPGFTVEFSAAQLDAEGTDEAPAGSSPGGGGSGEPSSAGSGTIASDSGGGGASAPFAPPGSTFAPTFAAGDSFASSVAPTVTPSPEILPSATPDVAAGGAGGAGTAASVESGLQPVAAPETRGESPPWGRLLLLIPLSLAAGAAGAVGRRELAARTSGAVAVP